MAKTLVDYLKECYSLIKKHCFYNDGTPIFEQRKIDRAVIACQFDMLVLLKGDFSSLEKVAMVTAKEYWLSEAVELTPIVQLLQQKLSDGLAYKTPQIRARRSCLLAMLQIDEQNLFERFEEFLEAFAVLDVPIIMLKSVLDKHFEGVLKGVEFKDKAKSFTFANML